MQEMISEKFTVQAVSKIRSWRWLRSDFADFFRMQNCQGNFSEKGPHPVIWSTGSKFVLLVSEPGDPRSAVYKSYRRIRRKSRWFLRFSPNAAEAVNYSILAGNGFPVAELLAVGDERKFWILQKTFLVTEFCAGFVDGRAFLPGGEYENSPEYLHDFAAENFRLLARLHDMNLLHKGFTPANLLFRIDADGKIEVKWIDVAGCKKMTAAQMKKSAAYDFVSFFRYFDFSPEERRKYCEIYLENCRTPRFSIDELSCAVEKMFSVRGKKSAPPVIQQREK